MQATYRLRGEEITGSFIRGLRDTYQNREIEITIHEVEDETAYLLQSGENRNHLLKIIEADKQGQIFRTVTAEALEAMIPS
ncbi:MAG: hypothetical protein LBD08_06435 [Treponema sp.]|jgi:antitoxin YefM|nr:hypothetical protein [Treponema sp.]